jgi:hypothetical protein
MNKQQVSQVLTITINTAIETLANVHSVSVQAIGSAISSGNKQILGEMAALFERMEQGL